ncbi:MAG: hypothetical protein ISS14_04930 [Actinobacteria bacterium]|nr:hypothetical protein [Actinomycetota bacterium]
MADEKDSNKDGAIENFAEMIKEFGNAVSEIFKDPELKKKAKEFGESAVDSAKTFGNRFKDEDVKNKFKDVGKAAQKFGESVSEYFKDDKKKQNQQKKKDKDINSDIQGETYKPKYAKTDEEFGYKADQDLKKTRSGRIVGYSFSIAWSIVFIIFFNFFNKYIAYYNPETVDGVTAWTIYPLLTADFNAWLPILNISLIVSIIGSIILIIYDKYYVRNTVHIVTDIFGIAAAATLLSLFPFNFTVIPNANIANILNLTATIILILIIIGLGVGILVRFIKLIIGIARHP